MEGVILFADDYIFEGGNFEYKLFLELKTSSIPILPINNLNDFNNIIKCISTYKAIIIDWEFVEKIDEIEKKDNPLNILMNNDIFSLIYVYSQTTIGEETQNQLKDKYGDKIDFLPKIKEDSQVITEKEKILSKISEFENENKHLSVPFVWSQAINQSAQAIFTELEQADPNWIKEIYNTAKNDGTEPNLEVIGVFQNLLSESVIQNEALLKSLSEFVQSDDIAVQDKETSLSKLYNRIYYTKLIKDAPLMTGDIFKFSADEYAILFTPECDINAKKETALEFLKFSKSASNSFIDRKKKDKAKQENKNQKFDDSFFNNSVPSRHLLLSFPFETGDYNSTALIDFETAFVVKSKADFDNKRADYKLNSPYIYQLRQRFLAFIGRVGVPAIPQSLRMYNLKENKNQENN